MKIRAIQWIGIALLSVACIRQIDDLTFVPLTPEVSVPVGKFILKAENITKLNDTISIQENSEGVIELFYEEEILRAPLFERLSIPDQSFNESVPFTSFIFSGGTANQVKISQYSSFKLTNTDLGTTTPDLTRVIFKAGTLNISQSKDFDHQVETTITFPTFKKNGNPITVVLNNNNSFSTSLDLADLDLTGGAGTSVNTIDYEISALVSNTGSDTQGTVSLNFSLTGMGFSFVRGDFKTYMFDEAINTFDLGVPDKNVPTNVGFTNPSVEIVAFNSTGIPLGLDINELSVTKRDGTVAQVTGTYDDNTYNIAEASTPGETKESNFIIDKSSTDNFIDLLNEIPESAYFNGQVTANFAGTPAGGNFVTDTSEIVINTKFYLPFEGYANDYVITDTIDADLNIDDEVISFENLNVRLQVENSFPLDIGVQLYFLDSANNTVILDSLFFTKDEQQLFPAAQVDATGLVVGPTQRTNNVTIDKDKYDRIRGTGSIKIAASIATPGGGDNPPKSIKISIDNYFSLGIGISAKALIDPNAATN